MNHNHKECSPPQKMASHFHSLVFEKKIHSIKLHYPTLPYLPTHPPNQPIYPSTHTHIKTHANSFTRSLTHSTSLPTVFSAIPLVIPLFYLYQCKFWKWCFVCVCVCVCGAGRGVSSKENLNNICFMKIRLSFRLS